MSEFDVASDLLALTQDKIAVVSAEGLYRYVNDAAEDILGYAPAELIDENVFEYVHPADREETWERFRSVVTASDEAAVSAQYRHRARDDSWVWLESRLSNERASDVDGYVVSSRDVTDRVRAETRLDELATKSPDVLWTFSADWERLLFVSDGLESIYSLEASVLDRRPKAFLDQIHPDDVPRVEDAMARASSGHSIDLEYRVDPEENYRRWLRIQAEPVFDAGEVVRIVGFSRDVTDRHKRKRQLTVMDNLLRHNIRNNMNAITGNAELIARLADDEIAERAGTITRVAMDLIDTAQKQRTVIELLGDPQPRAEIDVVLETGRIVDVMRSAHPDAEIETDLPESAPARIQPQIGTAIQELVTNSIEHADRSEPRVRVSVTTREHSVDVEIADDNEPIPEYEFLVMTDDVEMDSVEHPSGMGLWLVYWVVEMSGGSLGIDSGESGNVVTLELPRDGVRGTTTGRLRASQPGRDG